MALVFQEASMMQQLGEKHDYQLSMPAYLILVILCGLIPHTRLKLGVKRLTRSEFEICNPII